MTVLDEGRWDEPREPIEPEREILTPKPKEAASAVWIGQAVACTTFTCGLGFRLDAGDADLVEARRQPGRAPDSDQPLRFTVRCPKCHLTTDLFVPVPVPLETP